jgi:hypothetical protein
MEKQSHRSEVLASLAKHALSEDQLKSLRKTASLGHKIRSEKRDRKVEKETTKDTED